ncbi:MAG: hypothetical protein AAF215_21205 [Cyanobacteria bacterium P01_A01_bin.123]
MYCHRSRGELRHLPTPVDSPTQCCHQFGLTQAVVLWHSVKRRDRFELGNVAAPKLRAALLVFDMDMDLVTARKKSEYRPSENPSSLENLSPRETLYDEPKKQREVMVTQDGWDGFKAKAKKLGLSASELRSQLVMSISRYQ